MKWSYIARAFVIAAFASLVAADAESAPQKAKSPETLKQWSCPVEGCGFSLASRHGTEAMEMVQQHQRKRHETYLTDDETKAELKESSAAAP